MKNWWYSQPKTHYTQHNNVSEEKFCGYCFCVCVCDREKSGHLWNLLTVKQIWKVYIPRKNIKEKRAVFFLSSLQATPPSPTTAERTHFCLRLITARSFMFLIFAFVCTYKNWNLAWVRLISLPPVSPQFIPWIGPIPSHHSFLPRAGDSGVTCAWWKAVGSKSGSRARQSIGCQTTGRIPHGILGPSI